MSKIVVDHVSLSYPLAGQASRSFKSDLFRLMTAGRVSKEAGLTYVNAVKDISFSLQAGDYLGLVGRNGSGKTTLLKVLAGIYEISRGHLSVEGRVSALLGGPSICFQPELTAYENIRLNGLFFNHSKKEMEKMIADIEAFTELGDFLSLPVKTYSSGMQARLGFAMSTAIHPDILIVDEVIGTGDADFMAKAKDRMTNLVSKANILVIASHSTEIIKQFCNKLLWLHEGEIKAFGAVDEVMPLYTASTTAPVCKASQSALETALETEAVT